MVVFHPLTLTTTTATFTPFFNNANSSIEVSYEMPASGGTTGGSTGGSSRLIQFDLKDTVKNTNQLDKRDQGKTD